MTTLLSKIRDHIYSKKNMVFFEHYLDDHRSMKRAKRSKWKVKLLEEDDYQAFSILLAYQTKNEEIFKPDFDINDSKERIQEGHLCFICYDKEKIIGYQWYAVHEKYIPELMGTIVIADNETYQYNSYLLKEYRLKTAAWAVIQTTHSYCHDAGFKRVLCATLSWNKPPQIALKRIGYKQTGQVTVGYFFTLRYFINNCSTIHINNEVSIFEMYLKLGQKIKK